MKKWKLELTVEVAQCWIEDGFDLAEREDQIKEAFHNMLPYAHDHEMKIEIKSMQSRQFKYEPLNG